MAEDYDPREIGSGRAGAADGGWPDFDGEGRPVHFTDNAVLPDPREHCPTLAGARVVLEPLLVSHVDELWEVGKDPALWRFTPGRVTTRDEMARYVGDALAARENGTAIPFVTRLRAEGGRTRVVGSTRFGNIDRANRRMEIGWTWIGVPWQRTFVNTEAKYLMLRHAFEDLGALRIELKTDSLNVRSREAILRLGAVQEGVFRNHLITQSGRVRHSVYFSIVQEDWIRVRDRLESLIAGG